jgi:hypothetical protein
MLSGRKMPAFPYFPVSEPTCYLIASPTPWRWRQQAPPKCLCLHDILFQQTVTFKFLCSYVFLICPILATCLPRRNFQDFTRPGNLTSLLLNQEHRDDRDSFELEMEKQGDLGVGGYTIYQYILQSRDMTIKLGCIWIRSIWELLWTRWWFFVFSTVGEFVYRFRIWQL